MQIKGQTSYIRIFIGKTENVGTCVRAPTRKIQYIFFLFSDAFLSNQSVAISKHRESHTRFALELKTRCILSLHSLICRVNV